MLSQLILIFGAVLSTINCNCGPCEPPPKHYEELGCVGEYIDGSCCPDERFECPDISDKSVCYKKGKTYKLGDKVADADSPNCQGGCVCDLDSYGYAIFRCPITECASWFYPSTPGCVDQHSLNGCCAAEICGDEAINLPECHYNGKTYTPGHRFYPEDASCYICICDEHFDNSTNINMNKNCKRKDCGMAFTDIDKFRAGCVPLYFKDSKCCPIGFRCPNEYFDKVVPYEGLPDINSVNAKALCKFGNLTLQRLQSIETYDEVIECRCKQPPMIECIKKN